MFRCGPKYFSECIQLERVYKYALRMANELHKLSPTQNQSLKLNNS